MMLVLSIRPEPYEHSAELRLAERLFRAALPPSVQWVQAATERQLLAVLPELLGASGNRPVLVAREPALAFCPGALEVLLQHLESGCACVLPCDQGSSRPSARPDYLTQRGFLRYCSSICADHAGFGAYDGRPVKAYLTRSTLLSAHLAGGGALFDMPRAVDARVAWGAYLHDFSDYYSGLRTDILPLIPTSTGSLLDIGCGEGRFGALVREQYNARVAGIELNPHEAARAAARLDAVWTGDILTISALERFDCITCLDMIEHVAEPERLLKALHSWLRPGGSLILSVPNVGHWSAVLDLLEGHWDYVPAGLHCVTHLRFFTRRSLESLLLTTGWQPVVWDNERIEPPAAVRERLCAAGLPLDWESLGTMSLRLRVVPT